MSKDTASASVFSDQLVEEYVDGDYDALLSFLVGFETQIAYQLHGLRSHDAELKKSVALFYSFYLWTLQIHGNEAQIKDIVNDIVENADGDAVFAGSSSSGPGSKANSHLAFISSSKLIQQTIRSIGAISKLEFDVIPLIPQSYPWGNESKSLATLVEHAITSLQNSFYTQIVSNYTQIRISRLRSYLGISPEWTTEKLMNELNIEHQRRNPNSLDKWSLLPPSLLIPPPSDDPPPFTQDSQDLTAKLHTLIDLAKHLESDPL